MNNSLGVHISFGFIRCTPISPRDVCVCVCVSVSFSLICIFQHLRIVSSIYKAYQCEKWVRICDDIIPSISESMMPICGYYIFFDWFSLYSTLFFLFLFSILISSLCQIYMLCITFSFFSSLLSQLSGVIIRRRSKNTIQHWQ